MENRTLADIAQKAIAGLCNADTHLRSARAAVTIEEMELLASVAEDSE